MEQLETIINPNKFRRQLQISKFIILTVSMSKNKTLSIDNLSECSPDFAFTKIKDRIRQKLHALTVKILQYQTKNYPPDQRKKISLDQIAKNYLDVLIKHQKFKAWTQMQNPESQHVIHENEQDTMPQGQNYELSEEEKIYLDSSILSYIHNQDSGKKWKININPQIDFSFLKDSEISELLSLMYMFENGYFPFVGKKESKSKIFVQHMDTLKKRPSKQIETFKTPLPKDWWVIFSLMVERLEKQSFAICVEIISIRKDVSPNKIEHELDMRLKQKKYSIAPGEIKFFFDKDLKIKPELIYKFGDNSFFFPTNNAETTKRIFPSKIQHLKVGIQIPVEIQPEENFDAEVHILGDNSNYESVRYIYKELENNDHFSYTLSPSEYEVLQTRGNLIVIGRSGTGKTTCALLRLFFKELNNTQKTQRNVFLTASPVLIAEINKKYDQLKDGIRQIHNYDYFEQSEIVIDEKSFIKKFYGKIDEINETFMRQRISSFLSCKVFPCFLTIREYIQSIDAMMQNPFFSTKSEQNQVRIIEEQIIISYPDEIRWEERVRKTRKIKYSNLQKENQVDEQEWLEITFNHFAKTICQLPEIKRISGTLSPEIIWAEIYSTIKGSSRAHSFFGKFLDFETYTKESKNKFLDVEDKKKVYEVFTAYEKIKQTTKQYDLLDVVNNIIIQLGKRQNHDLALSSLFIDEVQDLPPAFIFLAGKIVQQSLFFSGDTAQTISKGVSFRFSDIRDQFSQKYFQRGFKLEKPKIKQLGVNFRSQNQIIQFSNCLIRCLEMIFPDTFDHIPFEISPNSGPKPVIMSTKQSQRLADVLKQQFGNLHGNNRNNLFGADKAIIVRNKETKKRIPNVLGSMTCLTYEQCKGLQYNVVILYRFFTSSPEVQWSFLKHIELESRPNGMKGLAFNKNHLGSNIKMYFDLCSELKILYTVMTRPRTILIICDDNIPEPLMRIWNFLDVIQRPQTFYRDLERQLNHDNNQNGPNNKKDFNDHRSPNRENERSNVTQISNIDRNEQNFQKFRKQWIDEGFKLFFDHKLYDQAAKCFENAQIKQLQEISKAFFYATFANNEAQSKTQQKDFYNRAGVIFDKYRRNYEAGKCFFLSEQYNKALRIFNEMKIKKYEAQCFWKMKLYEKAQAIFLAESLFKKCFNVLIESEYWYLMFKRLYERSQDFKKLGLETIRKGLDVIMESMLWTFTPWILLNWNVLEKYDLQSVIKKVIFLCQQNVITKKTSFFYTKQVSFLIAKSNFLKQFPPQKKQETDEIQYYFVTTIFQQHGILKVINTFFTTLMYVNDLLADYHLNSHFKKYNLENFNIPTYDFTFSNETKRWANSLQIIFNILEKFGCYQFIAKLASSLGFNNIQQLITIQNFLRIDGRKLDTEEAEYKKNLHWDLVNYVEETSMKNKLSLLLLIFGWTKSLGHMFEKQDMLMSEYFGNFETTPESYSVKFKPFKIIKEHDFICFDQNSKKDFYQRTIRTSYQYQKIFSLIDDITPNSFLVVNQKQKEYIEYFKSLTKQEVIDLEQKQKLAVQQKLGELQKKIKRSQDDLVFTEKSKNEIFANTYKEEEKAVQQKIKIMKYIKKYVWTPQQCEKNPQKAYKLKKDIKQVKSERNKLLDAIDAKTKKKIEELKNRENTQKIIFDLSQKLKTQNKILEAEKKSYLTKIQQVSYQRQIVTEIEKELAPHLEEIRQLESEKKGTNKQDKKLNHRIKNIQDKLKDELKMLNERKKDYEKCMSELKEIQHKVEGINTKAQELEYQIRQNKEFICQLNLAKLDDKGELQFQYSPQHTKNLIKQYIVKWQPNIKEQDNYQKDDIVKDYKIILRDVDEYLHFHEDVPKKCQQDRKNILRNIQNLKESIEKLHKQKENEKLRTQAKVKVNFQSKCFKKHCWEYRRNYIAEMILQNPDLNSHLDTELINVIDLIKRLTLPGSKTEKDRVNKNSTLLDEILSFDDSSFQKLWIILHFIIHQQELELLQTTVVKEQYQRFLNEMQKFMQNIKQQTEQGILARNTLAILGINVIEATYDSDLKYLQGFSILEKSHNFASNLKAQFFHTISPTHILCRTFQILQIVTNHLIEKIKSSDRFRTFQRQQFIPKQIRQFKMGNNQFFKSQEKYLINQIRQAQFKHDYLTTAELRLLKQDLVQLKTVYVSELILLEGQQIGNVQVKAMNITCVLEKVIDITNFVHSLDSIILFNRGSIKKVNQKNTFIDQATQAQAKDLKNYILPKIQKVMDKLTPSKPKDNQSTQPSENTEITEKLDESPEKQQNSAEKQQKSQEKLSVDPKIYEKGTMQQKKPRKKKTKPENVKAENTQKRVKRPERKNYYPQNQYQDEYHPIVQEKYEHKAYYDITTGKWVSSN